MCLIAEMTCNFAFTRKSSLSRPDVKSSLARLRLTFTGPKT